MFGWCFLFYFETFSSMWNIRWGRWFFFRLLPGLLSYKKWILTTSYNFCVFMCVTHKYLPGKNCSEICWPLQMGKPIFLVKKIQFLLVHLWIIKMIAFRWWICNVSYGMAVGSLNIDFRICWCLINYSNY